MCSWTRSRRFTARGGAAVEAELDRLVASVGDVVRTESSGRQVRSLLLIGGYGRGEGGVELRNGREYPHNNLDFLLVTRGLSGRGRVELAQRLDESLAPVRTQSGLGIDLSVVAESRLRTAPSLVIWYDARFGHRVVLGDQDFLARQSRFRLERVPNGDVLNLLVNRGALLLINDCLAEHGVSTAEVQRIQLKHWMKAVIGYGDALLFSRGLYDWSYREKQLRFRTLRVELPELADLYEEAVEFRFSPDYGIWDGSRLKERLERGRPVLEACHLEFERWRLRQPGLDWEDYLGTAAARIASRGWIAPRSAARKLVSLARGGSRVPMPGLLPGLGTSVMSLRERLSLAFPALAYPGAFDVLGEHLGPWLEVTPDQEIDLPSARRRYLELWGVGGDHNFGLVLRSLGLDLTKEAA